MNGWSVPEPEPVLSLLPGTPLARRLRAGRLAAGLTGPAVLAMTGIDPGNLSRMESGKRVPTVATLITLAKLYGIPLATLAEAAAGADLGTNGGQGTPETLSPSLPVAAFVATPDPAFRQVHERDWQARADLRENARRFALEVFEPVQAVLGVPLRVESGYRSPGLDRRVLRDQAPFSAHTHALAADVIPLGISVRGALPLLRAAVDRGDLEHLDLADVESGLWLHLQAAPDALPARHLVARGLVC